MKKNIFSIILCFLLGGIYLYKNDDMIYKKYDILIEHKNQKKDYIYSVLFNKKDSKVIYSTHGNYEIETRYKDGRLKEKIVRRESDSLFSSTNYNKFELIDGKATLFKKSPEGDVTYSFVYKNNILNGEVVHNGKRTLYKDGTPLGKEIFQSSSNMDSIVYFEGVPNFIDLKLPSTNFPKNLVRETVKKNYTGGVFSININFFTLKDYEKGILVRERKYINNYKRNIGIKVYDRNFFENGLLRQEYTYNSKGILISLRTYNENGVLDGLQYYGNPKGRYFEVFNYSNGILHGNYQKYIITGRNSHKKNEGYYDVGIYTGTQMVHGREINFLKGYPLTKQDLKNQKKILSKIHKMNRVPKKFTGYNLEDDKITKYKYGKVESTYRVSKTSKIIKKVIKEGGDYKVKKYSFGRLMEKMNFDKKDRKNGEFEIFKYGKEIKKESGEYVKEKLKSRENVVLFDN